MAPPPQSSRGRGALTARLFVYGTLTPGGDAWVVLAPWTVGEPVADAISGALYDTGRGYPCAVFDEIDGVARGTPVHGVVVELDAQFRDGALVELDRYEGPEYRRVTVRTRSGLEAFAFVWIAPRAGCRLVPNGRWPVS